ncbi:Hemocyte protease-3 [Operophtera brumata]|uniref:Hemocyte protease-3 n=1 Tax=Operophtera brumata TaxID=104452 RepID=A0A0L7LRC8_OPEBR|nr:Hemocyte protease-3 [Operophtera brumata]
MTMWLKMLHACVKEITDDVGIIGGHQITIESVPFMASLRLNGTYHSCGGSIIHERFVLTAAHCIVPNRKYKILVGTDRIANDGKLYDIEKIMIHKKYSNKTYNFDVCLIKLATPLKFGRKRNPFSDHLLQVAIPTISRLQCQDMYQRYNFSITHQMICAGKVGEDSCQGDSGGPLTKGNAQVGVTFFGLGCGVVPGVYVKISTVRPWIKKTITENLLN